MKAVQLRNIDQDYRAHQQAFLNFAVKAEKRVGKGKTKPVYRMFKQFYDYEKAIKKANGEEQKARFSGIGKLLRK